MNARDRVVWITQKRDEIDEITSSLSVLANALTSDSRTKAHFAVAEMHSVRMIFSERLHTIAETPPNNDHVLETTAAELAREWEKVDLACDAFMCAAADNIDVFQFSVCMCGPINGSEQVMAGAMTR
jgi:hypothetical protein